MRTVTTFEAKCTSCGSVFPYPALGDMVYGEFILAGEEGRAYACLSAIGNKAWDVVAEILSRHSLKVNIADVVARVADTVEGQRLTTSHICPDCGSKEFEFWEGRPLGSLKISEATFSGFHSLSQEEREQVVLANA